MNGPRGLQETEADARRVMAFAKQMMAVSKQVQCIDCPTSDNDDSFCVKECPLLRCDSIALT